MQAGEFSFSSLLPVILLYRCRTRWRGCSSDFFHHFPACGSAPVGRLEAAMTFNWFLSGLGCSCLISFSDYCERLPDTEGNFVFHLQQSLHCCFNELFSMDLDSVWWPKYCFASFLCSVWHIDLFLCFLSDALREEVLSSPKKPGKPGYKTKVKGAFWLQPLEFLMEYFGHFKGIHKNTSEFPF